MSDILYNMVFDRQPFLNAVTKQLEPNILKHSLVVEACMGALYDYLSRNGQLGKTEPAKEAWLLAGLIHDIDYSDPWKQEHPLKTKEALGKYALNIPDSVAAIVQAHAPEKTQVQPKSKAQWALFCMDSLTGLIVAVALVHPSKTLHEVKVASVTKRLLKQPNFAAGTRRKEVAMCASPDGLNIPLEQFIGICLTAMQGAASQIGL